MTPESRARPSKSKKKYVPPRDLIFNTIHLTLLDPTIHKRRCIRRCHGLLLRCLSIRPVLAVLLQGLSKERLEKAQENLQVSLNAGDGAMQVRRPNHMKLFREMKHSDDEEGKRFFKNYVRRKGRLRRER
jgi:hypothetical protein